jgi:hypothetical protein
MCEKIGLIVVIRVPSRAEGSQLRGKVDQQREGCLPVQQPRTKGWRTMETPMGEPIHREGTGVALSFDGSIIDVLSISFLRSAPIVRHVVSGFAHRAEHFRSLGELRFRPDLQV